MPDQDTPTPEVTDQLAQQRVEDVTTHLPQPNKWAPFEANCALKTATNITELKTTYVYNTTEVPLLICVVYVEDQEDPLYFVYSMELSDGSPKISFNANCLITVSAGTTNVWVPLKDAVLSDEFRWLE